MWCVTDMLVVLAELYCNDLETSFVQHLTLCITWLPFPRLLRRLAITADSSMAGATMGMVTPRRPPPPGVTAARVASLAVAAARAARAAPTTTMTPPPAPPAPAGTTVAMVAMVGTAATVDHMVATEDMA